MVTRVRATLAKPIAGPNHSPVRQRIRRGALLWVLISGLAGLDAFLASYFEPGDLVSFQASSAPPSLLEAPLSETTDGGTPPQPMVFELGGQTATLDHPQEMRAAGMTWVKFQIKWEPGARGGDVAARVDEAHRHGFKMLLSVSGPAFPSEIDYDAYVDYLSEAAAYQPDAIEVWNEQNLAREWPVGQISGANYVNNMLAPAYTAIKHVNPNVMVISGALAPTGYFGGCKPEGCDDAIFFRDMMAARAYYYMDCIGVHFNSGATPPSATSGHPADGGDGHYTWYYQGTVGLYGYLNLRPLCFTELGYVSPEGYGDIAGNFAWAANTSVAQHAAWLAETVTLAHGSGNVRLIIVFNVDLDYYGPDDPQAGYAILRPEGTCPACEALAAALPS